MTRGRRVAIGLAVLALLAAAAAAARLLVDRQVDGSIVLAWPDERWAIYRWSALAAGTIVGAALAISGTMLQALLRNPLASPFILGLSSGAGLGVMIQLAAAHFAARGDGSAPALLVMTGAAGSAGPAMAGALGTLAVVYALSQRRGWLDPVSLVLIGVVVSTICAAGMMFCQHLVPTGIRGQFTSWLMGFIPEAAPRGLLALAAALTIAGGAVALAMGRAMDAATLGETEARSVGVALGPLRLLLFVLAGLMTAVTVALAGPIAFVGLIAPHAGRLILGPRHGPLVVGSALCGVIVVVGADAGRQAIDLGAGRMPIGVFTALIGGPAFIWLLLSRRGQA